MEATMDNDSRFAYLEIDDETPAAAVPAPAQPAVQAILEATPFRPMPVAPAPVVEQPKVEIAKGLKVVKEQSDATGTILFWRLAGEVDVQKLSQAVTAAGLSAKFLPNDVTPGNAFTRATEKLKERQVLVRKHPAGGVAIVEERTVGNDLDYRKCCRIYLEEGAVKAETLDYSDTETEAVRVAVEADYNQALTRFSHNELSTYLVGVVRTLKGVTFTRNGGFYYISKSNTPTMATIQGIVEGLSGSKLYLLPVADGAQSVRAVFDAVALEKGVRLNEIQDEINAGASKTVAKNRLEELAEMADDIRHYEEILGADFKALKARREEMVAKLKEVRGERASFFEVG